MKLYRLLLFASLAALFATIGDLMMLRVANSTMAGSSSLHNSDMILMIGGILGVVAIPLYGSGYWAVAQIIKPASILLSTIIFACGVSIAFLGAVIHGYTALIIHDAPASGASLGTPIEFMTGASEFVFIAWIVATLLVLIASMSILIATRSAGLSFARWPLWLNPAVVTPMLAVIALTWDGGQLYLLPAAPNVAHIIFFSVVLFMSYSQRKHGPDV